jgi:signal transduction histidine kinase
LIKTKNNDNSAQAEISHVYGGGSVPKHNSRSDWTKMSEPDHFVQFYESEAFLLTSLNDFIGAGLDSGDACIVVATKAHRAELKCRLRESGRNPVNARTSGRYISLDAAETLSKFMVAGAPDAKRFTKVIGDIINQAAACGHRVRIFGEMVALLFEEEKGYAAIQVEELWNKLAETHPFTLFCAYPLNQFKGDSFTEPFKHVCNGHTRVLPTESYAALTDTDDRLRTITLLQQQARSLEAEIVERRRAEEELLAVKDKLEIQLAEREQLLSRAQSARFDAENANRLKDEFLATISHELRTPLNAILGWSRLLLADRLDEATKMQAIATINRNVNSQMQLVEDILDVSRIITGNLRLDISPFDIASVINAAIDSVLPAADSKNIRLEIILDPAVRHISGDADRLQQIIWNLLSNAVKFTPSGGLVSVRLKRAEDSGVEIGINDTGQGIKPDFLPFIFDRFRQADGSSTRRHGGLGLGLAIVRHLVELHGGTIRAESPGEGGGSTFTIKLPPAFAPQIPPVL